MVDCEEDWPKGNAEPPDAATGVEAEDELAPNWNGVLGALAEAEPKPDEGVAELARGKPEDAVVCETVGVLKLPKVGCSVEVLALVWD